MLLFAGVRNMTFSYERLIRANQSISGQAGLLFLVESCLIQSPEAFVLQTTKPNLRLIWSLTTGFILH
jgi:hypothetical protein